MAIILGFGDVSMRRMPPSSRRGGVSEVVGALLLIVVVVAAVASLAIVISQAQTNAANRSAYTVGVKNEDLKFASAQFSPNNPEIQWQLTFAGTTLPAGTSHFYYAQVTNMGFMLLTPLNSTDQPSTAPPVNASFATGYSSLNVQNDAQVVISSSGGTDNVTTAAFGNCPTTGCWAVAPATWNSVTLYIQNLNTQPSKIYQVSINGNFLDEWYSNSTQLDGPISNTNPSYSPYTYIPARYQGEIRIPLTTQPVAIGTFTKTGSLKVSLETQLGNTFTEVYTPPIALVSSSIQNEDYQVSTRDILTFSGAQSSANGSSIESYEWQFVIPSADTGGSGLYDCTTAPTGQLAAYVQGNTVQYTPESLFDFAPTATYTACATGPVEAVLTVVDSNGLTGISNAVTVPPDQNIAPPAGLSFSTETLSCGGYVHVSVENILGQDVPNAGITAIGNGVTVTPSVDSTGTNGTAMFDFGTCTSGATVEFESGALTPQILNVGPPEALPKCTAGYSVPANYPTIQDAITAATDAQTICVSSGTYQEQLTFGSANTGVTLYAPSGATIAPTSLLAVTPTDPDDSLPNAPIIYVYQATGVDIWGFDLDGSASAASVASTWGCGVNFEGILYLQASGSISGNTVNNIIETPIATYGGCQTGLAINVETGNSGASTVTILGNTVTNYQKNGITCDDTGTSCTITDNAVSPNGPNTANTAPNGIQIAFNAAGTVSSNTVSGNVCDLASACGGTPSDLSNEDVAQSCGILTYQTPATPTTTINHNTLTGNDIGVCLADDAGTISPTANVISGSTYMGIELFDESQTVSGNTISMSPYGIAALSDSTASAAMVTYSDSFSAIATQDCTAIQTLSAGGTTYTGSASCVTASPGPSPIPSEVTSVFALGLITAASIVSLIPMLPRTQKMERPLSSEVRHGPR
jgi:hypothetical protein